MTSRTPVVIALGISQTLAWASTFYLPAIIAGPMAADLGMAPSAVLAAFSAALLLSALLGPFVGHAIDRRGGRGVLCLSNLVLTAGLVALAAVHGPVGLVLGWLVLGVAMALGLYDSAFATLAGLYGQAARGPITGITLIAGFASTIGWSVTGALVAGVGWRGACLAWAAAQLLLALPLNRFLVPHAPPPMRGDAPPEPTAEAPRARMLMVLLAVVFAASWMMASGMAALLPRVLEVSGCTPGAAIAAASLQGPAQVLARLLEFSVFRRWPPLFSARLATLLHPAGALVLALGGAALAPVFTVLHGAGNGMMTIAKGTLPLALFGAAGYGRRSGLITAPSRFTQAAAPLLFGLVLERWGLGVLVLSAGLSLVSAAVLFLIRPGRG